MNIIIVNDDGWESKGSSYLIQKLREKNKIYAYFPYSNSSGYSNKISLNCNIDVNQVKDNYFIVKGSPVDCILVAIQDLKIKGIEIDLVISGINDGLNYGAPIIYSGTVAAALEASNYGIPSIAISFEGSLMSSRVLDDIADWLIKLPFDRIKDNSVINMNILERKDTGVFPNLIYIENEVIDYSFKLPKVTKEKMGYRIAINNSMKQNNHSDFCMIGIYNRFSGFVLDKQDKELLNELKLTFEKLG
ncbi:acid phosphatase [Listeria seeligeri]|uniref:5'/3'-nucleotidase SurE n=1 Tax=Listeria seeligeri TaxID=1640 RepID=UPI0016241F77|nr:5'/3'-nucleotidase SurE [Listeria seeligeri]MBC1722328.1 acid phosphatase [Listeria seeligeri]MBF2435855.1 acid phosphatase [Listeria seeligeri]MBF2480184.1 acid phosphatase [Listeria seeligeri]MBF2599322.1 acid phosphatase [Listeria seeligeri]